MKKILFGITSLTIGGAERVLVDLSNKLQEKDDFEITIFTIYSKGDFEKSLNSNIKVISLYDKSYKELTKIQKIYVPIKILFCKKSIYKRYIKGDYDTEIAFLEGPITRLFSIKNKNTKKIAWIHNDMSLVFGKGIKAKIKRKIDRKIYSKFSTLVFVSEDNRNKFEQIYPDLRNSELEKVHKRVVYNYIDKDLVLEKAKEKSEIEFNKNELNFVSVCRLVEQKAIERLIEVHNKLINDKYMHKFYIIGDGPLKEKLEAKIKEEGLEKTFILLGQKENPYPYIRQADYFCLLSYFEGYPMVVEEAKILNKEILITDTAAREVVKDYQKSSIFENTEEGIYKGLKKIIQNSKLKSRKIEEVKYNNEKIIDKVIKILGE